MTAIDTEPDHLKKAVENMHRGKAALAQSVPVREIFDDKTVWEGVVHLFDLADHPDRDSRLRLVLIDRGEHEATILRSAASTASK